MTTTDDDDGRNTVPIARPLVRSAKNEIKYFIWLKSHLRLAVLNEFSRVTQWDVSCTHMVTVGVKKDGPNLFLPARRYASAGYRDRNVSVRPSVCPSICPSVCPSVTRRYCVKTKKASGVISSPSGSPETLVF